MSCLFDRERGTRSAALTLSIMPRVAHCRVSFTGSDGITHIVNVDADALYEAIGLAVAEFRSDKLTEIPGAMTEFTVSIERPAVRAPDSLESGYRVG